MSTKKADILAEAKAIVYGRGEKEYGHPRDNFQDEADAFTAYLRARKIVGRFGREEELRAALEPRDVAMLNILQKVIRDGVVPKHDNLVDIIGYSLTAHRVATE